MMKNNLRVKYKKVIKENNKSFVISLLSDFLKENEYKNIGIYLDIRNEISMDNIIELLDANLYVPYMKDDGSKKIENACMLFKKYNKELLCFDDFNIRSSLGEVIDSNELDIIIIPGICFNVNGYRIGYGKGCYDKALSNYNKTIIGVCYDNCFINDAFEEDHDIQVDYVFTEKRFIKIRG